MLSIIIASCNEGNELLWTVENARLNAGCAHEVIVVDDASKDGSADRLPAWVRVIQTEKQLGVAPARRLGVAAAQGEAFMFLDAHMRMTPGAGKQLYDAAVGVGGLVTAPLGNLYGSKRTFWNDSLRIDQAKGRLCSSWGNGHKGELAPIHAFVAPGYVITRAAYERVGGWPSRARGWGQTEVCLSLKLLLAGVPMCTDGRGDLKILHLFRAGETTSPIPYRISGYDPVRNNYVMCRMCFQESFETFWLPLAKRGRHWKESFAVWDETCERERAAFQAVKVLPDEEFFRMVLGMTMTQAQEKFLHEAVVAVD